MTLDEINSYFDWWKDKYNQTHINQTTSCTPKERFDPNGFSPLPVEKSLGGVFCWKYTRKLDSCNQFSFQGVVYTIPVKYCMVAFKVDLRVTPGEVIRVWHQDEYICTLIHRQAN